VVSCHSSKAGAIGRMAARLARTPCIFTAHGWAFTDGVPLPQRLAFGAAEAALAPLSSAIVTVSRNDLQLARRWLPHSRSRLHLIHNGVHDVESTLMSNPSIEPASGIFVGRFGPQKDHDLALQAVAAVPGASLRLVGGGPARPAVEDRVRSMGLEGRVEVTGERSDVAQLLASAQFLVLLSRWEGLPRSIIEAMRAGLPVVASDVGGTSELVDHGRTGFLVPRGDLARATDAIEALVRSPALRRRMGSAGRSRYERCFRFDRVLRETRAIYDIASGAGS